MFILKIDAKIDFSAKNSKKFVYYNENMYINSKFQTQFSRKLQRFRGCRKNKKCSIFHELSEYVQINASLNLIQGKIGFEAKIVIFCIRECFYAPKTCAFDFSHKITPRRRFPDKKMRKTKITIFASKPIFP